MRRARDPGKRISAVRIVGVIVIVGVAPAPKTDLEPKDGARIGGRKLLVVQFGLYTHRNRRVRKRH